MKKLFALLLCIVLAFTVVGCGGDKGEENKKELDPIQYIEYGNVTTAKNIILLIGDGMGMEQVRAGQIYQGDYLYMQKIPNNVKVETRSADNSITDSAAAGTALSTGKRTNNGYICMDTDQDDLKTIVDIAHDLGKRTGVVTTEKIWGATPMAFSSYGPRQDALADTLVSRAAQTGNVNLFISDNTTDSTSKLDLITAEGYTEITAVDDISESNLDKIVGMYPITATAQSMTDYSFDRIVMESIEYLSKDQDGFFLMAEGGHIDHRCHSNDLRSMIDELLAFDLGVKAAVEWARQRTDTVVLVTADHETGGLKINDKAVDADTLLDPADDYGNYNYSWGSSTHTDADVYLYLYGKEMDYSVYSFADKNRIKNIDIFKIMKGFFPAVS